MKAAKVRFGAAYADAEAGKVCCRYPFITSLNVWLVQDPPLLQVGSQYLDYTPEVEKARKRFFRFFDFVLNGGLAR